MLQNESNDNDRNEVKGDFPVSFHYTAVMIVIMFISLVSYFVKSALKNLVKKIG